MARSAPVALLLVSFFAAAAAADSGADPFPAFADLPPGLAMPDDAGVTVDAAGNYLVAGRPRFLVGTQLANTLKSSMAPTEGYPAALRWLYEEPLGHDAARRLGLDALGFFTSDTWISEGFAPAYRSFHHSREQEDYLGRVLQDARLPVYVDYTCAHWSNGKLATRDLAGVLPAEALNAGGAYGETNHWVPYSAISEAGRAVYRAMWRKGAEDVRARGVRPLFYELFNEPAYDDPSSGNRARFAARLQARFGSVAELNRAWGSAYASFAAAAGFQRSTENPGLQVEWSRFMEEAFADLCRLGVAEIRAVDPQARCCVQVMGADRYRALAATHVNLALLTPDLQVVSTGTGGGITLDGGLPAPAASALATPDPENRLVEGMLHRHFLRAIAGGRPIHDGEAYMPGSADGVVAHLWLQLLRGGDAAFFFLWEKRAWDANWLPRGSAEGGRRVAERQPWMLLNPWATPTGALTGMLAFKRQLARLDALAVPHAARVPARVAVLLSLASERIAPAVGLVAHQEVRGYAAALEFSHHPIDVILEEQLAERAGRYQAIVAAGVRYAEAGTRAALARYVSAGGTLVLGLETLERDIYGQPSPSPDLPVPVLGEAVGGAVADLESAIPTHPGLPGRLRGRAWRAIAAAEGWEPLARLAGRPALLERRLGAGRIAYLGAQLPVHPLAALLDGVLARAGIAPACTLRLAAGGELATGVEVQHRQADGVDGWFLVNHDRHPKLVTLAVPGLERTGMAAVEPLAGRRLPLADGRATVLLMPKTMTAVVCGDAAALAGYAAGCVPVTVADLAASQRAWTPPVADAADGLGQAWPCDQARAIPLDLRRQANRHFIDQVAGDGVGGWTDQGAANSLVGVPYGRQTFCGVPFDIIRYDENADRTCLAMRSPHMAGGAARAEGIAVGREVGALYFLHAAAWSKDGAEVLRYEVRYADGGTVTVPVRSGYEIGDWWTDTAANRAAHLQARLAWRNAEQRGLWVWRWANPEPGRTVERIDVVSADQDPIGVVVAITAEAPAADSGPSPLARLAAGTWTAVPWHGAVATCVGAAGRPELRLDLGAQARAWCGVRLESPAPATDIAPPAAGWSPQAALVLHVNGGGDAWGVHHGGQELKVSVSRRNADGTLRHGPFVSVGAAVDADDATWQAVAVPMNRLDDGRGGALAAIAVQFSGVLPVAGVRIADLAITP